MNKHSISRGARRMHHKREANRRRKLKEKGTQIDPFGFVDTRGKTKKSLTVASVTKGPRDGSKVGTIQVVDPAPSRQPFGSAEDVLAYISADRIECMQCGQYFAFLPRHLAQAHQISAEEYRLAWHIPASVALAGQGYRAKQSAKMLRMIADGDIVPAHGKATEAARIAGSRVKVPWQMAAHSELVAAVRPGDHAKLQDGAKRADGRDADAAREYQRRYRERHQP